jgi:hypothetical protein
VVVVFVVIFAIVVTHGITHGISAARRLFRLPFLFLGLLHLALLFGLLLLLLRTSQPFLPIFRLLFFVITPPPPPLLLLLCLSPFLLLRSASMRGTVKCCLSWSLH